MDQIGPNMREREREMKKEIKKKARYNFVYLNINKKKNFKK